MVIIVSFESQLTYLDIIQTVVFGFIKKKKIIDAIALITEFKFCPLFARWPTSFLLHKTFNNSEFLGLVPATANIYPRRFISITNIVKLGWFRKKMQGYTQVMVGWLNRFHVRDLFFGSVVRKAARLNFEFDSTGCADSFRR